MMTDGGDPDMDAVPSNGVTAVMGHLIDFWDDRLAAAELSGNDG